MKKVLWATIALSLIGLPALSQESEIDYVEAEEVKGQLQEFEAIDRNADGELSWEEIRNQVVKIFHDSDTNGDGALDESEFKLGEAHWVLSDINENGKVDLQELSAHAAIVFGHADTNGDDKLSKAEAEAAREKEGL